MDVFIQYGHEFSIFVAILFWHENIKGRGNLSLIFNFLDSNINY